MTDETRAGLEDEEPGAIAAEPMSEKANLLAHVRELREAAKRDHHLDLPIPGLNDLVWIRFRPFPFEKTERKSAEFQKLMGKQPIAVKAACDTLIDACEQVMLLKPEFNGDIGEDGVNLMPIDEDALPPIGFDQRLAEAFGIPITPGMTARQIVLAMFPTEHAVVHMNIRVSEWMQDVTRKADGGLLGE